MKILRPHDLKLSMLISRTLPKSYKLLPKDRGEAKVWVGEKLWIEKKRAGGRGTAKVFFSVQSLASFGWQFSSADRTATTSERASERVQPMGRYCYYIFGPILCRPPRKMKRKRCSFWPRKSAIFWGRRLGLWEQNYIHLTFSILSMMYVAVLEIFNHLTETEHRTELQKRLF